MNESQMIDPDITDEQLTAYLDGESDEVLRAALDEALALDADLRRRLEALKIPESQLTKSLDLLISQAPPTPKLPPLVSKPAWIDSAMPMAASMTIGAVFGAAMLSWLVQEPKRDWMDYVAAYQALYVEETLVNVSVPTSEEDLVKLGNELGHPIQAAAIDPPFEFKRAQMLGFEGKPLVQMAFLSEANVPIALCITPIDDSSKSGIATGELEGLTTASWSSDGFGYLLIGDVDTSELHKAADQFRAKL